MTRENDQLTLVRRLVLVFDICSSTTTLEDLKQTDNLAKWRDLLIGLKRFMLEDESAKKLNLEVYKFIGDGWILLFPTDISKHDLVKFLSSLSMQYDSDFDMRIRSLLQRD